MEGERQPSVPTPRTFFSRLASVATDATDLVSRTAASAHGVLSDKDLRKETSGKLVRGIHNGIRGGLIGIGSTANAVKHNIFYNVNESLSSGRRGAQAILDRVQLQLHQQRLRRALLQASGKPVDVQVGFTVYLDVPQEMRSRLWYVLLQEPALAIPFQELGRFPDLGNFDMSEAATPRASMEGGTSGRFITEPLTVVTPTAEVASLATPQEPETNKKQEEGAGQEEGESCQTEAGAGSDERGVGNEAVSGVSSAALVASGHSGEVGDISDACSDEHAQDAARLEGSMAVIKGGEVDDGELAAEAAAAKQGPKAGHEGDWEVVEKGDTLQDGSYVGPASFANSFSMRKRPAGASDKAPRASPPPSETDTPAAVEASAGSSISLPTWRVLNDAQRRRQEAQEATALKMKVSENNIKDAIIACAWPVVEVREAGGKYDTLLQMNVGQEEVEEIIRRDINRTFPEHPRFLLGQGQQELFNVLKAYSMIDMEVGYCQGMGFLAGILLMYMPEQLAFQVFSQLMSAQGPNLRRLYLDGLADLKQEMAMFEFLLARHHPRLAKHLKDNCVPCVLYVSQWLLTSFACPFPAYFTAQLIDIMLLENCNRIIMQTCMAIMAEVEERLLRMVDFEDIITCLKTDLAQWSDEKLRGVLTAGYLSSVSEAELDLAEQAVNSEMANQAMSGTVGKVAGISSGGQDQGRSPGAASGEQGEGGRAGDGDATGAESFSNTATSFGALSDIVKKELGQLTWAEAGEESSGGAGAGVGSQGDLGTASVFNSVRLPGGVEGSGRFGSMGPEGLGGESRTRDGEQAKETDERVGVEGASESEHVHGGAG